MLVHVVTFWAVAISAVLGKIGIVKATMAAMGALGAVAVKEPRVKHSTATDATITIGGQLVKTETRHVPIEKLKLWKDNPRFQYRFALDKSKTPEELLRKDVTDLVAAIKSDGGLMVPVDADTNMVVREGNRRLMSMMILHEKEPDNVLWQFVPTRIIHASEAQWVHYLIEIHASGKEPWGPLETAGMFYRMIQEGSAVKDIVANHERLTVRKVQEMVSAYEDVLTLATLEGGKYAADARNKFSYLHEFRKNAKLVERAKRDAAFTDRFLHWVGEGKFHKAQAIRELPAILEDENAAALLDVIENKTTAEASAKASQRNPDRLNPFFAMLAKVRKQWAINTTFASKSAVAKQQIGETITALQQMLEHAGKVANVSKTTAKHTE